MGRLVEIPFGYTKSFSRPSGSIKIWWLSFSLNLLILSSIDGQYLGPMPDICPEYMAERWVFSSIIVCVVLFVLVIKQEICGNSFFGGFKTDIGGAFLSPGCSSISLRLMLESFIRAGVPVFNLPIGRFRSYSRFAKGIEVSSPTLPPDFFSSPLYITPFRNVPVVKIVFFENIFFPEASSTPLTAFSSTNKSITSPSSIDMFVFANML